MRVTKLFGLLSEFQKDPWLYRHLRTKSTVLKIKFKKSILTRMSPEEIGTRFLED